MPRFAQLLRDVFNSVGNVTEVLISRIRVPTWVQGVSSAFGSPCVDQTIATRDMLLLLILPIALIVVLSFLNKRKKRFQHILDGRPGPTSPIDFFSEHSADRWNYCMSFIVTGTTVCAATFNKLRFEWEEHVPLEFYIIRKIAIGLYIGTLYYPLFASLSSKNVIGFAIGCVYAWLLLAIFFCQLVPCFGGNWLLHVTSTLGSLPMLGALIYLTISIPIRFATQLKKLYKKRKDLAHYIAKQKPLVSKKSADFRYVERLLRNKTYQKAQLEEKFHYKKLHPLKAKLRTFVAEKIYSWDSTFRYSLTVLIAFTLSLTLVYQIFLRLIFFWVIKANAMTKQFVDQRSTGNGTYSVAAIFGLIGQFASFVKDLQGVEPEEETYPSDENATDIVSTIDFENELQPTSTTAMPSWLAVLDAIGGNQTAFSSQIDDIMKQRVVVEALYWLYSLKTVALSALIAAFFTTVIAMLMTLRNYKSNLMDIRRGLYTRIPDVRSRSPRVLLSKSCKYIGYQAAYSVWGFVLQAALFAVAFLAVTVICSLDVRYNKSTILHIIKACWPYMLYPTVLLMLDQTLAHLFLQRNEREMRVLAINNRRCFFNYGYFMIFLNVALGLLSCIKLLIIGTLSGAILMVRLDVSTLSRSLETSKDPGFCSYLAMLIAQNNHCNPVLTVFVKLLRRGLLLRKATEKLFAKKGRGGDDDELYAIRLVANRKANSLRAKTRWALAYTLHNNPGLRAMRKRELDHPKFALMNAIFASASNAYTEGLVAEALANVVKQQAAAAPEANANGSDVVVSSGWLKARQAGIKKLQSAVMKNRET